LPTFSVADPVPRPAKAIATKHFISNVDYDPMLLALQDQCAAQWGEYPRPVSIQTQDGQWLFKFKNHEADKNPSTFVLGNYKRLMINGTNAFSREFFLPDEMSAQVLGNYLSRDSLTGQRLRFSG
jgi:hypothetical protein